MAKELRISKNQVFSRRTELEKRCLTIKRRKFSQRWRIVNNLGRVHTMPAEFENGCFTLRTHRMFSFHTTPEELINGKTTGYFGFVVKEGSVRVSSI